MSTLLKTSLSKFQGYDCEAFHADVGANSSSSGTDKVNIKSRSVDLSVREAGQLAGEVQGCKLAQGFMFDKVSLTLKGSALPDFLFSWAPVGNLSNLSHVYWLLTSLLMVCHESSMVLI